MNQNKGIDEAIDVIKAAIIVSDVKGRRSEETVYAYTFGRKDLSIITKDDYNKFYLAMNTIYSHVLKKEPHISYTYFEKCICRHLVDEDEDIYEKLISDFSELAIVNYTFIRPMHGIEMKRDTLQLGPYTFISKSHIQEQLKRHCEDSFVRESVFAHINVPHYCFVETETSAKDIDKAREDSNALYQKLDNVLRFMLGSNDKNLGLGIFNYKVSIDGDAFCKASNDSVSTSHSSSIKIPVRPIVIDEDDWFYSRENGNSQVWDILSKPQHSEIEKRLLKSIEWIGLSINEQQTSIAFCQCAFAIECMLQDQKDFITKSITAQIGEYAAFIVGYDMETRKEIAALFSRLYGIRSKIAHGEKQDQLEREYQEILFLSKQIVINFLLKPELQEIYSVADLRKWIIDARYS